MLKYVPNENKYARKMIVLLPSEGSKGITHYLGDKNRFDVSSEGPSKGLRSKRRIYFYRLGSE